MKAHELPTQRVTLAATRSSSGRRFLGLIQCIVIASLPGSALSSRQDDGQAACQARARPPSRAPPPAYTLTDAGGEGPAPREGGSVMFAAAMAEPGPPWLWHVLGLLSVPLLVALNGFF